MYSPFYKKNFPEIKEENKKNIDTTLLLIDDEAENASINTKHNKGEITKINEGIRLILKKAIRY